MIIALFLTKAPNFQRGLDRVDWSGVTFCVGILSSSAAAIAASAFVPGLPVLLSTVVILAVGGFSAAVFANWRGRITRRREADWITEINDIREGETLKQLAAARASGAFNRWQARNA